MFLVDVDFPIEYPFKGPKVRFATRIYHPNVDEGGSESAAYARLRARRWLNSALLCTDLCVGILKSEAWKPSTKAATSESGTAAGAEIDY